MFYCEIGQHLTKPGQRCVRVVTERREKEYVEKQYDDRKREVGQRTYRGLEIAKETKSCPEHAPVSA